MAPNVTSLDGPTWLYQAVCEHNGLLYVGIASDLSRRLAQHRATKPWWSDVDAVVAGLYPSRTAALTVEAGIIGGANPVHNIAGKPPGRRTRASEWTLVDRFGQPLEAGA